ncbi:guanylate cyclase, partial [Plakobranchus ocellatus]
KEASERPWYNSSDTPERNEKARKAYESLMTVTLRKPVNQKYKNFSKEVKARAEKLFKNFTYGEDEVNSFVGAFHDAVILYAIALNESLAAGVSISNGSEITRRMWNRTFSGITGTVSIDENGDRNADYSLLDMDPNTGLFRAFRSSVRLGRQFMELELATEEPFPVYLIVIIVLVTLILVFLIAGFFVY